MKKAIIQDFNYSALIYAVFILDRAYCKVEKLDLIVFTCSYASDDRITTLHVFHCETKLGDLTSK